MLRIDLLSMELFKCLSILEDESKDEFGFVVDIFV